MGWWYLYEVSDYNGSSVYEYDSMLAGRKAEEEWATDFQAWMKQMMAVSYESVTSALGLHSYIYLICIVDN